MGQCCPKNPMREAVGCLNMSPSCPKQIKLIVGNWSDHTTSSIQMLLRRKGSSPCYEKGCKKHVLCFYVCLSVDHPYHEGHNLHASPNIFLRCETISYPFSQNHGSVDFFLKKTNLGDTPIFH